MLRMIGALAVLCVIGHAACADGSATARRHSRAALWPDHHIIEVAVSPPSGREYIINGARFSPKTGQCGGWVAGNRINMLSGDWHGWCWSATFENLSRHRDTCEMWCGYAAGLHP